MIANPPSSINSVVQQVPAYQAAAGGGTFTLYFASAADDIPAWGTYVIERDRKLKEFWPTENVLASAIYSMAAKYASLGWTLEGPSRQTDIVRRILHNSEHGQGWNKLMTKTVIDVLTQDNASFIEVVRTDDTPISPVVQLNHLDSSRCRRTGRWDEPIIYFDILNKPHLMKYYQVAEVSDFPSSLELARGLQYCMVTRVLRAAQIIRDIKIYNREKVGGRWHKAIHLVSGVAQRSIDDVLKLTEAANDNLGLQRFGGTPVIISTLDPTAPVTHEQVDLASLPDNFDADTAMRWYIAELALAAGVDYAEFAPLPGGNLGTSTQSQVLSDKARAKGPALFMRTIEHLFNFHGIMPRTVNFKFGDQDIAENAQLTQLQWRRAQMHKLYNESGILDPKTSRQIMRDDGDLKEEYLELFGEADITPAPVSSSHKQLVREVVRDSKGMITRVIETEG